MSTPKDYYMSITSQKHQNSILPWNNAKFFSLNAFISVFQQSPTPRFMQKVLSHILKALHLLTWPFIPFAVCINSTHVIYAPRGQAFTTKWGHLIKLSGDFLTPSSVFHVAQTDGLSALVPTHLRGVCSKRARLRSSRRKKRTPGKTMMEKAGPLRRAAR